MARVDRFWEKVEKTETCWLWTSEVRDDGYARFKLDQSGQYAHRVAYELLVGPIPEGLTLDHLCRVRHCVNPAHLEPVTQRENTLRGTSPVAQRARQTECIHGHPFDDANTYRPPSGGRKCRTCGRAAVRRYQTRMAY